MPIKGVPFSDEQLFATQIIIVPAWLLLAFAPAWRVTQGVAVAVTTFFALM